MEETEGFLPAPGPNIIWPAEVEAALPPGTKGAGLESCRQFRQKVAPLPSPQLDLIEVWAR